MTPFRYASPRTFLPLSGRLIPIFGALAAALGAVGLYLGFVVAPTDAQQGEVYRIIFIHVPAAWMAMFIYLVMALYAVLTLGYQARMPAMMMRALAPTGAWMAAIALWTGSLWGKSTWGTYWAWDARMTSTLILLFLYLGFLALCSAIEDPRRGDRASAVLLLAGAVNIPVIYFSVRWWNTLHQGASIRPVQGSTMSSTMLNAMLVMTAAAWCYSICAGLHRARSLVIERESHSRWLREEIGLIPRTAP